MFYSSTQNFTFLLSANFPSLTGKKTLHPSSSAWANTFVFMQYKIFPLFSLLNSITVHLTDQSKALYVEHYQCSLVVFHWTICKVSNSTTVARFFWSASLADSYFFCVTSTSSVSAVLLRNVCTFIHTFIRWSCHYSSIQFSQYISTPHMYRSVV